VALSCAIKAGKMLEKDEEEEYICVGLNVTL
jgi:hypothetical protein